MNPDVIKELLKNILALITRLNIDYKQKIFDLTKETHEYHMDTLTNLIAIRLNLKKYKLRNNLNMDEEMKRVEILKEELEKEKKLSQKSIRDYEFKLSEDALQNDEIRDLIIDILELIENL